MQQHATRHHQKHAPQGTHLQQRTRATPALQCRHSYATSIPDCRKQAQERSRRRYLAPRAGDGGEAGAVEGAGALEVAGTVVGAGWGQGTQEVVCRLDGARGSDGVAWRLMA